MSLFGKLFGSDSVKERFVDGVYNGVDKIIYTEEEKKDNHKVFLQLYEPFKVAQRYLALIFGLSFSCLHTLAFTLRIVFYDNEALQKSISMVQGDLNESMGVIVLTIVGFYFCGGTVEGAIKSFMNKK